MKVAVRNRFWISSKESAGDLICETTACRFPLPSYRFWLFPRNVLFASHKEIICGQPYKTVENMRIRVHRVRQLFARIPERNCVRAWFAYRSPPSPLPAEPQEAPQFQEPLDTAGQVVGQPFRADDKRQPLGPGDRRVDLVPVQDELHPAWHVLRGGGSHRQRYSVKCPAQKRTFGQPSPRPRSTVGEEQSVGRSF